MNIYFGRCKKDKVIMTGSPPTMTESIPLITFLCASIKFALIFIVNVYFFFDLLIHAIWAACK